MEEDTNQPLTPLGNERRSNPGQTNIMRNSDGESIVPTTPSWTDDTSLEDIAKQYTGVGGKYNDLVENAADNVGDRQVQLVGNDFGATNPYMFNTYYEPAATSFASEMRMQGTQKAVEVGIDRAEQEAQKRLETAQSRYNNAVSAAKEAAAQKSKNVHVSETDMSVMPADTSEDEWNAFVKLTEGMTDAEKKAEWEKWRIQDIQDSSDKVDWNQDWRKEYSTSFRRGYIDDATWKNMSAEDRQAWWDRTDIGNAWTKGYMVKYFGQYDGGDRMAEQFDKLNKQSDMIVDIINGKDFSEFKNYDFDLMGVDLVPDIKAKDIDVSVLKEAIENNERFSDEQKKKYLGYLNNNEAVIRNQIQAIIDGTYSKSEVDGKWYYTTELWKVEQKNSGNPNIYVSSVPGLEKYSEIIEAFGGPGEYTENLSDFWAQKHPNDERIFARYSGQNTDKDRHANDAVGRQELDDTMKRAYGVDFSSLEAISKIKEEDPEKYNSMRDHCNFAKAGGTAAFETVTDKDKKYFINGKYWSASDEDSPISVGDIVFHSIDGTIKSDGEFRDADLKKFVNLYKKIYNGDVPADDENLAALQSYYNSYAKDVAIMTYLASVNDIRVDENLYSAYLAMIKGGEDKLDIVNPSDPNGERISVADLTKWFNSWSDDEKYNTYTALVNKAYESRGYLLIMGDQGAEKRKLEEKPGIKTVGKYGKSSGDANMKGASQVENLSPEQALAILAHVDWQIHNGKINAGFLPNDEVQGMDSFVNSFAANAKGFGQFWAWAGSGIVGAIKQKMGYSDKDNPEAKFAGEVWKDMTTLDEGDDWGWAGKDDMTLFNQYTEDIRKQQRSNLNHLIDTTMNLDYFDPDNHIQDNMVVDEKGQEVKLDNMHYNHMDDWKGFTDVMYGMAGAITEFAAESALTAGVKAALGAATAGIGTVVSTVAEGSGFVARGAQAVMRAKDVFARIMSAPMTARGFQSAMKAHKATEYIKDCAKVFGDDAVRAYLDGSAKTIQAGVNNADNAARLAQSGAKMMSSSVDNVADDVAKAGVKAASGSVDNIADDTAKAGVKAASGSADNIADDAVKTPAQRAAATRANMQKMKDGLKWAKETLEQDYAIRYGLDSVVSNTDDAARSFGRRFMDKVNKIAESGYIDKKLVSSLRSQLDDVASLSASRAAMDQRLAAKIGVDISRIQNLSDETAGVLYGIMQASESSADDISTAVLDQVGRRVAKAGKDVVLEKIDFQKAASLVVEQSERIAAKGGVMSADDIFRTFATQGAVAPSDLLKSLRRSDFLRDRIKDWSRDIAQNYWTPELDNRFESHYVDFETYITSPQELALGALFDIGSTGLRNISARSKLFFTNRKIDKIMGGVDLSTANKADLVSFQQDLIKLDKLRSKAVKLENKILDGTISFDKVHTTADSAEQAIKSHIKTLTDKFDLSDAELIVESSTIAKEQANALAESGLKDLKTKRKYRKILADADNFNRIVMRGNDKLMAVSEASNALQQVSMLRYLDIDTHAKTIHKMTGEQWGKVYSNAWKEITGENFAAKYGDQIGIDGKAFVSKSTINFDDPAKTKAAYAAGQTFIYDKIYDHVRDVMGDSLTTQDYRELRVELNLIRDRMIDAGNQLIDDGRKVRWNYIPTQALTWEAEPGSMSSVRALWGWDYKGGEHTTFAGEVNNPIAARDMQDFSGIIDDFDNGVSTFKRRKGDREIALEGRKNPSAKVDPLKDVPYNWAGFDPAFSCNAYLNSLDSARIVQPLLDPINGVIVKNPKLAQSAVHLSNLVLDDEIQAMHKKYNDVATEYAKNRHSAKSLEHRAKTINDLTNTFKNYYHDKTPIGKNVSKHRTISQQLDADIQKSVYSSPMVKSLEPLYSRVFTDNRIAPEARSAYIINKIATSYSELGDDIKAVRDMYTPGGKIKKEFLGKDGNLLPQFSDAQGNPMPSGAVSSSYSSTNGTQYRMFVNQLAQNKNVTSNMFELNNANTLTFDDGTRVNAKAFEKHIFDVLATKQTVDLGMDPIKDRAAYNNLKAALAKAKADNDISAPALDDSILSRHYSDSDSTTATIGKYLQPVSLDSDNARAILTNNASAIISSIYGDWVDNPKTGKKIKEIVPGSPKDKFFHNIISTAFDDVEANGGEISTYDFVKIIDKHVPDFAKDLSEAGTKNFDDFLEVSKNISAYENSGGTSAELLDDFRKALNEETVKKKPDEHKIQVLQSTIAVLSGEADYAQRTTNRASGQNSLDYAISGEDADDIVTSGDVTANPDATVEVNGTYVPAQMMSDTIHTMDAQSGNKVVGVNDIEAKGRWAKRNRVSSIEQQITNTKNEIARLADRKDARQHMDKIISLRKKLDTLNSALEERKTLKPSDYTTRTLDDVAKDIKPLRDEREKLIKKVQAERGKKNPNSSIISKLTKDIDELDSKIAPFASEEHYLKRSESIDKLRKKISTLDKEYDNIKKKGGLTDSVRWKYEDEISTAKADLSTLLRDEEEKVWEANKDWDYTGRSNGKQGVVQYESPDAPMSALAAMRENDSALAQNAVATPSAIDTSTIGSDMLEALGYLEGTNAGIVDVTKLPTSYVRTVSVDDVATPEQIVKYIKDNNIQASDATRKAYKNYTAKYQSSLGEPAVANTQVPSATDLRDSIYVELNRHQKKPRYDDKTITALVDKYQDKIAKAQTADEIAKVSDDIAADLVPLDPNVKNSATEMKHAASDIQNAIFWAREGGKSSASAIASDAGEKAFKEYAILANSLNKDIAAMNSKSGLNIKPTKDIDKKAAAKGSIANKFIGYADGIEGSSTAEYAKQAGAKANTGKYSSDDVVFVSVPGKRGKPQVRGKQQRRTIAEAIKAIESGATLITDNSDYLSKSSYNEGEKNLAKSLRSRGYRYDEAIVDGQRLGVWTNTKVGSDVYKYKYGERLFKRSAKRNSYDAIENSFNGIADMLEKKTKSKVYRGNTDLVGATDAQRLAFMQDDSGTMPWKGGKQLSEKDARRAKIAGRDISGRRAFGNVEFMAPNEIDKFIRQNHIQLDDELKESLDNYRKVYNDNIATVTDPEYRNHLSDARVSMQQSVPEFLSSFNTGNKSVFDLNTGKYAWEANNYHPESEFWSSKTYRAYDPLDITSGRVGQKKPYTKYEYSRAQRVIDAETDGVYSDAHKERLQSNPVSVSNSIDMTMEPNSLEFSYYDNSPSFDFDGLYRELHEANLELREASTTIGEIKKGGGNVSPEQEARIGEIHERIRDIEKRINAAENGASEYSPDLVPGEDALNKSSGSSINQITPYMDYLNESSSYNISEAATELNNKFYGSNGKKGYFDSKTENSKNLRAAMDEYANKFDTNVTKKVTDLKKLEMAKDGEVADILQEAIKNAEGIEDPELRDYTIKRLKEELDFTNKNLVDNKKAAGQAFLDHDPEYRALKEARRASADEPSGSQIAAAIPTGNNPIFTGVDTPVDGHITLQQLVDSMKEVDLSRKKSGKNTLRSSIQERKVLSDMRKGGNSITSGPAIQQEEWIGNLYARIMESSGTKLPDAPTFEEIKQGFMLAPDGTKIALNLKLDEIYIDPKMAALGHRYWGEGQAGMVENFYKTMNTISSFNKNVQDIQLAGGVGQYNAFTLRNAITMMWQDPIGGTRALFTNFKNARSNDSVVQFYINNHDKLLKMAMDTGDYSALNAFTNVINTRDEVTGRGMVSEFGRTIVEIPDNISEKGIFKGIMGTTKEAYDAMFGNPTFVRWCAIAKADMQLRNYDKAERFVKRLVRQYNLTDEDFANMEGGQGSMDRYIAHIAQMRTDQYWTPGKFARTANNTEKYLNMQKADTLKRTTEALRSMPQKKTLRQCLSDYFFAIGYKLQMNAHPINGIASIFSAIPNDIRASSALRGKRSFVTMSSRFAGRGDRMQALTMVGIAAIAHAWNTHIGAPSAFEEIYHNFDDAFKHNTPEHGTYGIAQTLLNFQDFGKIYIPNNQDGTYDPNKTGYAVDPFFSVFTLQNSAFRAVNKFANPTQIPRNTQRTFGAGLLQQGTGQPLIGAPEPGSLWDRINGVRDELIGANLLAGYKAMYEVLNNSTYFGNNIWERKYLPDGTENPNYDPLRNILASVAHILNTEEWWFGDTTNRWVKGLTIDDTTWKDGEQVEAYTKGGLFGKIGNKGVYNGKTGTVAGSGLFQHEYVTALKHINDGEYFEALTESMELPFKSRNYAARARTQLNTEVISQLRNAKKEYDNNVKNASAEDKDKEYAAFAKKAVNIVHDWSRKNQYILGDNDELTASATKILVSFMSDEYDDVTNRVQNRYDKLRQELKMAAGDEFLFTKAALEDAKKGPEGDQLTDEEWAAKQNQHLTALKEAQMKEYKARQALIAAGLDPSVFDTNDYISDDISAKTASFDKKTYREIIGKLESPVGEFKNFKEMKAYYEARIAEATTTKSKAKLANMYNKYVTDIIEPYISNGYAAAAFNDIYWDGDNLSNKLGQYIILPADQYYGGKSPRTNYLKDMIGIGFKNSKNLPSDKDVQEQLNKVAVALSKGNISSASALVDNALLQLRKGYIHASPEDYDKLIRMRALLSSRSR